MENQICRLCLKEGATPLSSSAENTLSEGLLTAFLPEIRHTVKEPLALCTECRATLTAFFALRKTAHTIERQIEEYINRTGKGIVDLMELKSNRFWCETCRVCFWEMELYEAHLLTHTLDKRFQCKECEKSFSTSNNLQKHCRFIHGNNGMDSDVTNERAKCTANILNLVYICGVCHRKFPTAQIFREHKSRAHKEKGKHVCNKCGTAFSSLNSKRRHRKCCLESVNCVICPVCDRAFQTNYNLKRHLDYHKREGKSQKIVVKECAMCDFKFEEYSDFVKHLKVTHNRHYSCPLCYRIFSQPYNRKRHLTTLHAPEEIETFL